MWSSKRDYGWAGVRNASGKPLLCKETRKMIQPVRLHWKPFSTKSLVNAYSFHLGMYSASCLFLFWGYFTMAKHYLVMITNPYGMSSSKIDKPVKVKTWKMTTSIKKKKKKAAKFLFVFCFQRCIRRNIYWQMDENLRVLSIIWLTCECKIQHSTITSYQVPRCFNLRTVYLNTNFPSLYWT